MQNHRGHGLGLWLTKSIIEAHRGNVGVVCNGIAGYGCMFFIELPIFSLDYCSQGFDTHGSVKKYMIPQRKGSEFNITIDSGMNQGRWQEHEQLQKISNNMLAQSFQRSSILMTEAKPLNSKSIPNSNILEYRPSIALSIHSEYSASAGNAQVETNGRDDEHRKSLPVITAVIPYTRICALVVDDMRSNRKVLCKQLENLNCNIICTEVPDGSDAVQLIAGALKSRPPYDMESSAVYYDMIFMDSQMVTMDGAVAIEKIRTEHNYKGPIYGVTGDLGSVELLKEKGADEVYIKPIQISVLQTIVAGKRIFIFL